MYYHVITGTNVLRVAFIAEAAAFYGLVYTMKLGARLGTVTITIAITITLMFKHCIRLSFLI